MWHDIKVFSVRAVFATTFGTGTHSKKEAIEGAYIYIVRVSVAEDMDMGRYKGLSGYQKTEYLG